MYLCFSKKHSTCTFVSTNISRAIVCHCDSFWSNTNGQFINKTNIDIVIHILKLIKKKTKMECIYFSLFLISLASPGKYIMNISDSNYTGITYNSNVYIRQHFLFSPFRLGLKMLWSDINIKQNWCRMR